MLHEPSAIAPVAFAVVYEAGLALFRSTWLGAAVLTATVAAIALAPGHGGSFALLSQPGTVDRHVLVAVALTLFFLFLRHPGWALGLSLAAVGVEVLLVHTSTAVFLGIPLLGFVVARFLLTRSDLRSSAVALAALFLPAGAALAWLLPLVRETASHSPSTMELRRALTKYGAELNVDSLHHYALRPEVVSRGGAVAVAGLALVPLAAFAAGSAGLRTCSAARLPCSRSNCSRGSSRISRTLSPSPRHGALPGSRPSRSHSQVGRRC